MKAIFEVEFNPELMADDADVNAHGGWLKTMQWLFREEGLGIFENDLKLIEVKEYSKKESEKYTLIKRWNYNLAEDEYVLMQFGSELGYGDAMWAQKTANHFNIQIENE